MADSNPIKLCECGCGQPAPLAPKPVKKYGLRRGDPQRFVNGHQARGRARIDLAGRRFGKLVVIAEAGGRKFGCRIWLCQCDCGKQLSLHTHSLNSGNTKSCGCGQKQFVGQANTTHGLSSTPTYRAWMAMFRRCYDAKSHEYKNYGGRGISVCERWNTFESFLEDMGLRPSPKHSLDRFPNNDGNYESGNVRWATPTQQARNTRHAKKIEYEGRVLSLAELAEVLGIRPSTLSNRYQHGDRPPRLFRPIDKRMSRRRSKAPAPHA